MTKSNKVEMGPVHIPAEHQSAPKKTWADKEIEAAAEEIRSGQFSPVLDPHDPLDAMAVGLQRGQLPNSPKEIDMRSMLETQVLMQHPRVQEALARLEQEKQDARHAQEYLEKAQMLHELNANASKADHWDGQGRWIGKENEEMRIGLILTPFQFLERLEKVIGRGRVFINRYSVNARVALLAPDNLEKPLILMPGQPEPPKNPSGMVQVGTLQYPCGSEWMVMRFDEYGVPTEPKYLGWRTALLSMIRLGVLTEKEAHKAFPLGSGPAKAWYEEQLFEMRKVTGAVN